MLFNSNIFVFCFLPLVLALWWSPLMRGSWRLCLLTFASYAFYGWWNPWFVSLLVASTAIDYFAGRLIDRARSDLLKRVGLATSLCSNLGLLAFFKYWGFFATTGNAIENWLHGSGSLPVWEIILPVGISFYTFQTLSYSIDIYRGNAKPADSLWHFAVYVSLFPQLIAGPIVRYTDIESQLRSIPETMAWKTFAGGVWFFVAGMAQKILLADLVADRIEPLLAISGELKFAGAWYAMLGYAAQLYFDFAGYSNMAVGLGLMLGFRFPQNFDSPYQATNISDFWRRWHMSLSSWLRDYVYIALGGNRGSLWNTCRNLLIVMFLAGLWHGAGWTFVLWGLYHALLLIGYQIARQAKVPSLPRLLAVATTFACVLFGWVLFRAESFEMAIQLYRSMLGLNGLEGNMIEACGGLSAVGLLLCLLGVLFFAPNIWKIKPRLSLPAAVTLSLIFMLCVMRFGEESPFLYFQF